MCGRYMLDKDFDALLKRYNINVMDNDYSIGKEIFPSQNASIVMKRNDDVVMQKIRWGYKGFFGKQLVINARSETVLDKKLFKNSFLKRRCIIPANGFFEWQKINDKKIKRIIG